MILNPHFRRNNATIKYTDFLIDPFRHIAIFEIREAQYVTGANET